MAEENLLSRFLKHPFTVAGAVLAAILGLSKPAVVVGVLKATWASIPSLLPTVTVGLLTVAPRWPPSTRNEWIIVGVGVLFLAYMAGKIYHNYREAL